MPSWFSFILMVIPVQLHFPMRNSLIFEFYFYFSLSLSLSHTHRDTPPLSGTLSLSLFIIHGAVTLRIKVPRNVATATTEQKQPHWIMGNWVTSQEQDGGCSTGMLLSHARMHTRGCAHTHTPDRCPTKQADGEERGDEMETPERQNQAGQWSRYTRSCKSHMWACRFSSYTHAFHTRGGDPTTAGKVPH